MNSDQEHMDETRWRRKTFDNYVEWYLKEPTSKEAFSAWSNATERLFIADGGAPMRKVATDACQAFPRILHCIGQLPQEDVSTLDGQIQADHQQLTIENITNAMAQHRRWEQLATDEHQCLLAAVLLQATCSKHYGPKDQDSVRTILTEWETRCMSPPAPDAPSHLWRRVRAAWQGHLTRVLPPAPIPERAVDTESVAASLYGVGWVHFCLDDSRGSWQHLYAALATMPIPFAWDTKYATVETEALPETLIF